MSRDAGAPGRLRGPAAAIALVWVAAVVLLHLAVVRLGVTIVP